MSQKKPRTPPSDLDAQSKRVWKASIAALAAQGTWQDHDADLLERYVRALQIARELRGCETTAEGSQGQTVQHPDVRTRREAELDAHRYATDLLLTPAARARALRDDSGSGGGGQQSDPLAGAGFG